MESTDILKPACWWRFDVKITVAAPAWKTKKKLNEQCKKTFKLMKIFACIFVFRSMCICIVYTLYIHHCICMFVYTVYIYCCKLTLLLKILPHTLHNLNFKMNLIQSLLQGCVCACVCVHTLYLNASEAILTGQTEWPS